MGVCDVIGIIVCVVVGGIGIIVVVIGEGLLAGMGFEGFCV